MKILSMINIDCVFFLLEMFSVHMQGYVPLDISPEAPLSRGTSLCKLVSESQKICCEHLQMMLIMHTKFQCSLLATVKIHVICSTNIFTNQRQAKLPPQNFWVFLRNLQTGVLAASVNGNKK